ncbi:MAG: GNAT family N-acetyltransferase [Anaerolineae bacterium]|nr:GNAT family N-acetyltransferase [Anaerolineae bacterium]
MADFQLRLRYPEDEAFLLQLYASTRIEELRFFPLTEEQKPAFIALQYRAREQSYRQNYIAAVDQVILVNGSPVGRFLVQRDAELGLVDIALLPEYRGQGIGSALIGQLAAEGQRLNRRVWLHVAADNERAKQFYSRLGFRQYAEVGMYVMMERLPE